MDNRLEGTKNGGGASSAIAVVQAGDDNDLAEVVTQMTEMDVRCVVGVEW